MHRSFVPSQHPSLFCELPPAFAEILPLNYNSRDLALDVGRQLPELLIFAPHPDVPLPPDPAVCWPDVERQVFAVLAAVCERGSGPFE
jgi:hypothetical protein